RAVRVQAGRARCGSRPGARLRAVWPGRAAVLPAGRRVPRRPLSTGPGDSDGLAAGPGGALASGDGKPHWAREARRERRQLRPARRAGAVRAGAGPPRGRAGPGLARLAAERPERDRRGHHPRAGGGKRPRRRVAADAGRAGRARPSPRRGERLVGPTRVTLSGRHPHASTTPSPAVWPGAERHSSRTARSSWARRAGSTRTSISTILPPLTVK